MEYDRELPRYGAPEAEIAPMPPLPPPNFVTFSACTPICSPYSCRLSSHFSNPKPIRPIKPQAVRQPAWVSLQGRLIGAEEASSARTIGGRLSREQAVSWELFSPIHRILIVSVVAVAVANSKRDRKIYQLRKCVELKVVQLTRVKRPSFSSMSPENKELPTMRDNPLFDMDCTTSPSSSDSDSSSGKRKQTSTITSEESCTTQGTSVHSKLTDEPSSHRNWKSATSKISNSLVSQSEQHPTSRTPTPVHPKFTSEPSSHKNRKSATSKISTSLLQSQFEFKTLFLIKLPIVGFSTTAELVPEPRGLVLIISSWNFPLGGRHAAGNTAVLKPSELAPATSALLADALPAYVDNEAIKVIQGGADVGQHKWDKIFFTGTLILELNY
ncbi:hypothetical protein Ancab_000437 [Ancistrocladus abbreviatus]